MSDIIFYEVSNGVVYITNRCYYNGDNNEAVNGKPYQVEDIRLEVDIADVKSLTDDDISQNVNAIGDYTEEDWMKEVASIKERGYYLNLYETSAETPDGLYWCNALDCYKDRIVTVLKSRYTASDWHNMSLVEDQMCEETNYKISDPISVIASDIAKEAVVSEEKAKFFKGKDFVAKMISAHISDAEFKCEVYREVEAIRDECGEYEVGLKGYLEIHNVKSYTDVCLSWENLCVDYTHNVHYYIDNTRAEDLVLLVTEEIINPGKGCERISRIYREPFSFDDLQKAIAYRDEMMKTYQLKNSHDAFKIFVSNKDVIEKDWYKYNMEIMARCKALNIPLETFHYCSVGGAVLELRKRSGEPACYHCKNKKWNAKPCSEICLKGHDLKNVKLVECRCDGKDYEKKGEKV